MTLEGHVSTFSEAESLTSVEVTNYGGASFFQTHLEGLRRENHQFVVVEMLGRPKTRKALDYLKFAQQIRAVHRKSPNSVVHASYVLSALACVVGGVRPDVMTLWGTDLELFPKLSRMMARIARRTVVMSSQMATELALPCSVIPHGIDTARFHPISRESARAKLGWPTDERIALFPYDSSRPEKRFDMARRAVAAARNPKLKLVQLSGIPHDQMPEYYSAADLMLLTSEYEGLPNGVKEAMACSLPVVATPVGDLERVLRGVEPGGISETVDGLAREIAAVLSADRRSNGRERAVQLFDLGVQTRRLLDQYAKARERQPQKQNA